MTLGPTYSPPPSFGRFRLLHQIGAGVLGPVFRTHDPDEDRLVAVKVFTIDLTPEQAERLAEEFHRLIALDLPASRLATWLDAGVVESVAYLAQQYVSGESLDAAIRQYGPAPAPDAARLVSHVAEALDAGARVGVFHGALHPRDILVTPGETHLTGLGVAMAIERVGGQPSVRRPYAAPEYEERQGWGAAADVYALGAIAHEVLTGRRVVPGSHDPFPGLADIKGIDASMLRDVLESAIDPDPDRRPATAAEFANGFAAGLGLGANGAVPARGKRRSRVKPSPKLPGLDDPLADVAELGDGDNVQPGTTAPEPAVPDTPPEKPRTKSGGRRTPLVVQPIPAVPAPTIAAGNSEPAPAVGPTPGVAAPRAEPEETVVVPAVSVSVGDDGAAAPARSPRVRRGLPKSVEPEPGPQAEPVEAVESVPVVIAHPSEPSADLDLQFPDELLDDRTTDAPAAADDDVFPEGLLRDAAVAAPEDDFTLTLDTEPADEPLPPEAVAELQALAEGLGRVDSVTAPDEGAPMDLEAPVIIAPRSGPSLLDTADLTPEVPADRRRERNPRTVGGRQSASPTADDFRSPGTLVAEPPVPRAIDPGGAARLGAAGRRVEPYRPLPPTGKIPWAFVAAGVAGGLLIGAGFGYWFGLRRSEVPAPKPAFVQTRADSGTGRGAAQPSRREPSDIVPPTAAVAVPPARPSEPLVTSRPTPQVPTAPAQKPDARRPVSVVAAPAKPAPAKTGTVVVRSTPARADVFLDGARVGVTPRNLTAIPVGIHVIRVTRPGYKSQERTVTVASGHTPLRVSFVLVRGRTPVPAPAPISKPAPVRNVPAPVARESRTPAATAAATPAPAATRPEPVGRGTIEIETRPPSARVRLDGKDVGISPLVLDGMAVGSHAIRLELEGHRPWTTTVTIKAGTRTRIAASLERSTTR